MKNKAMITQLIRWVRWAAVSLILIGLSTRLLAEVNWAQRNIEAIGIVVTDAPKAAKVYHQLLGINDWVLVDLDVQGEDLPAGIRVARGQFNGVLIELLQPLYGDSAIRRYLAREGEGIFHLEVSGQGVSALADAYNKGYRPLLNVTTSSGYSAQWIDSWERLGVNLKLRTSEPDLMVGWGKMRLPEAELPLQNVRISQLGVVVEDAMATAKAWRQLLGIGPWIFIDFKRPHISNSYYLGAKGQTDAYVHVGYGYWQMAGLPFELELLQPVYGPSPHRDYLRAQGQGAHHLSFGKVPNHDHLVAGYKAQGLDIQMQSDNGGEGRTATYLDTESQLGWVLELTRPFKGLGSLQIVDQLPR